MKYPIVELVDICDEIYRYPSFYGMEHLTSGIPVIRGEHIDAWGNISQNWNDFWFIREEISSRFPRTILREGDLVFTVRGTIGKVGLITKSHDGAQLSPNLIRFSPKREIVNPIFLWYFLQSIKETAAADIQNEVTIASVRASDLGALKIPLPPLTEQNRIASLLARADRLRQVRRTAQNLGDELLQSVFLKMFGDPIHDSHKWQKEALIDIIDPERPITYGILMPGENLSNGIPYVRVVDIQGGRIDVANVRRTSKEIDLQYKRSRLLPSDLLLTIRGQVGRLAIVPSELRGANITQDTARLDPIRSKCNVYFLYGCLSMPSFQHLMQTLTRGVAVTGINLGDVKELPIPLPPLSLQGEFAGVVARVESLRARMSEAERQAEGLFQALLHDSFSQ